MSASLPRKPGRREGLPLAQSRGAQGRPAPQHAHPALHRHAGRGRGPAMAVQPGLAGLRPLLRVRGRARAAARAGGAPRLACGRLLLGRGDRHQLLLDRHRDRQSGPSRRAAALPGRADRERRRAGQGHRHPLAHPGRAGARPIRTSRPAASSIRASLSLGAPARGGRRPLGRRRPRSATAASSPAATRACRSRRCRPCSPCTATA